MIIEFAWGPRAGGRAGVPGFPGPQSWHLGPGLPGTPLATAPGTPGEGSRGGAGPRDPRGGVPRAVREGPGPQGRGPGGRCRARDPRGGVPGRAAGGRTGVPGFPGPQLWRLGARASRAPAGLRRLGTPGEGSRGSGGARDPGEGPGEVGRGPGLPRTPVAASGPGLPGPPGRLAAPRAQGRARGGGAGPGTQGRVPGRSGRRSGGWTRPPGPWPGDHAPARLRSCFFVRGRRTLLARPVGPHLHRRSPF